MPMPNAIFVTRRIPDIGIQMLEKRAYTVDVNPRDSILTQKQIIGFLKKKPYDAVLTLLTDHIDSAVFDASPTVKLFANYATGFDNIDFVEAKKRGVVVTNSPAELASTTSI